MIKRILLCFGCFGILIISSPSLYAVQNLEAFFPPSSLAVLVVPNLKAAGEKLQHYAQTLPSPHPLSTYLENVSFWQDTFERFSGIPLSEAGMIFEGSCALALLDPGQLESVERQHSLLSPPILLAANVSDAVGVQELLKKIVRNHIQAQVLSVEFHSKTVQGIELWTISNAQFQYAYTFWDQIFLFTTKPEYLERMLRERQCSSRDSGSCDTFTSLWNADEYHSARSVISRFDHDIRVHINVVQFRDHLQRLYRQNCATTFFSEYQELFQLAENFPVRSLTWLCSLQEQGGYERLFWEFVKPEKSGRAEQKPQTVIENDLLVSDQLVPGNVLYYQAKRMNFPIWWQQYKHAIETLLSVTQQEQFSQQLQDLLHTLSLDPEEDIYPEEDIFPALGSEVAIACYDPVRWRQKQRAENSLEHFPCLFLISLHQQTQLEQHLQAHTLSKRLVQGIPVYTLELPGALSPISVYGAFIEDFLVISASLQALQPVLTVAQQGGSLASLPDYAQLSASFATHCSGRRYFNLKQFFQRFPRLSQTVTENRGAASVSMTGILSVTTTAPEGVFTESFSTLGGTVLAAVIIALYSL